MSTPKTIQIAVERAPSGPVLYALRDDGEIFMLIASTTEVPQWQSIKPVPTHTFGRP